GRGPQHHASRVDAPCRPRVAGQRSRASKRARARLHRRSRRRHRRRPAQHRRRRRSSKPFGRIPGCGHPLWRDRGRGRAHPHSRDAQAHEQQQGRGGPSARHRRQDHPQQAQDVRGGRLRISTRFGIGAALAVLPLLGVMAYSVERMQGLAQSNERITMRQLVGIQMSLGVIRRLERLEEYQRKFLVSEDYGYALKFEQTVEATNTELDALRAAMLSPGEAAALGRLDESWKAFAERSRTILSATNDVEVSREFAELLARAVEVQDETRRAAEAEAEAAASVREEIRRPALVVAGIA